MNRAELLELLFKELYEKQGDILWEYCGCGCPAKSDLRNKECVDIFRILKALESYDE